MSRWIFTGFAPSLRAEDVRTALAFLCFPWKWASLRKGSAIQEFERECAQMLSTDAAYSVDSARSGIVIALKALGVRPGDAVLVQAYTCVVVVNAIRAVGAEPIFVDCTNQFSMDSSDARRKVTPKTRVLIIQHTFGIPADLDALLALAQECNLKTIEDCAQTFWSTYQEKKLGTFGDIAVFSFGSDKPLSCGRGGVVVTREKEISAKLRRLHEALPLLPFGLLFQHLLYFPLFALGRRWYGSFGRMLLGCAKRLGVTYRMVYPLEKRGKMLKQTPARLPNALATIALHQLKDAAAYGTHRTHIADIYSKRLRAVPRVTLPDIPEGSVLLRYPLLVENADVVIARAKKERIILGNWFRTPVAPEDTDIEKTGYVWGSCPNAERLARMSVNLPTDRSITPQDAQRVSAFLTTLA